MDVASRLRVRGEGNSGRKGGPAGDLFVFIQVREDPELVRDGQNIRSEVTIPYFDAILGTTVKVRTVDGPVDLKIPAGTQPGTTLLMSKRGVPKLYQLQQRGDHLVRVKVSIPQRLSPEERRMIEKLKETAGPASAASTGAAGAAASSQDKKGTGFGSWF